MEKSKDIERKITSAFESLDHIENVSISPFFKEKTMQRLFVKKEEKPILFSWFTPQLQLTLLVIIMVLNIIAIAQFNTDTYNTNISEFAETYGLSVQSGESLFN